MATGFVICSGTFALSANVPKTIISIVSTTDAPVIDELGVSFDGTTQTDKPVIVELCFCTQVTSGTSSPVGSSLIHGPQQNTPSVVPSINFTLEPTVITPVRQWFITPAGGGIVEQFPLGREPQGTTAASSSGKGIILRCTAAAAVNVKGYMEWEE